MMAIARVVWVEWGSISHQKLEVVQELLKQEESSTDITPAGGAGVRQKGSFGPSKLHTEKEQS